jgi:hypothetical protein
MLAVGTPRAIGIDHRGGDPVQSRGTRQRETPLDGRDA